MRIQTKTFRQFKILMNYLHKEGYKWKKSCCGKVINKETHRVYRTNTNLIKYLNERWNNFKSKTFITLYRIGEDMEICRDGFPLENLDEEPIKPFTEVNLKKLFMIKNLIGGDEE